MDKTIAFSPVFPCSKLTRFARRVTGAAFLLAVSAAPAATADISFTGMVVNAQSASFVPKIATIHIAGTIAILEIAVSSPDGAALKPVFTACATDGTEHAVQIMKSRRRSDGVLLARLQLETGGGKPRHIDICLKTSSDRSLCGRFNINHLY